MVIKVVTPGGDCGEFPGGLPWTSGNHLPTLPTAYLPTISDSTTTAEFGGDAQPLHKLRPRMRWVSPAVSAQTALELLGGSISLRRGRPENSSSSSPPSSSSPSSSSHLGDADPFLFDPPWACGTTIRKLCIRPGCTTAARRPPSSSRCRKAVHE